MKRWRCIPCHERGAEDAEWEDFRTQGFCRNCGKEATRIYEYGCFKCDDAGMRFWAEEAPHHPCPDCGAPAYRIVYAPYISKTDKRGDFNAADKMLETEMTNQGLSSTSLRKERTSKVPDALKPPPQDPKLHAHWMGQQDIKTTAANGGVPGSKLPFGCPRPHVTIAGSYNDPKAWKH